MASNNQEDSVMDDLLKDLFEDGDEEDTESPEGNDDLFSMIGLSPDEIKKANDALMAEQVEELEDSESNENDVTESSKEDSSNDSTQEIVEQEQPAQEESVQEEPAQEEPVQEESTQEESQLLEESQEEEVLSEASEASSSVQENMDEELNQLFDDSKENDTKVQDDISGMTEEEALADMLAGGFSSQESDGVAQEESDVLDDILPPDEENIDLNNVLDGMDSRDLSFDEPIEDVSPKKSKEEKKQERLAKKEAKKQEKEQAKKSGAPKEHSDFYYTLFGPDETEEELAPTEEELEQARLKAEAKQKKKEEQSVKKDQKAQEKDRKKSLKSGQLELKKADKKSKKEQLLKENEEEDAKEHRISKPIVVIVCVILLVGAIVSTVGGSMFSYTLSINKASSYFARQRYKLAYEQIVGIDVKEKDKKIAEQITTVMYVQKQLDSYLNFMKMDKKEEALNSLVKGVARYDEHIADATNLGIEGDMVSVETQIESYLSEAFQLTPDSTRELYAIKNEEEYNQRLNEIVTATKVPSDETTAQ